MRCVVTFWLAAGVWGLYQLKMGHNSSRLIETSSSAFQASYFDTSTLGANFRKIPKHYMLPYCNNRIIS